MVMTMMMMMMMPKRMGADAQTEQTSPPRMHL
jgi:hypothetical protein